MKNIAISFMCLMFFIVIMAINALAPAIVTILFQSNWLPSGLFMVTLLALIMFTSISTFSKGDDCADKFDMMVLPVEGEMSCEVIMAKSLMVLNMDCVTLPTPSCVQDDKSSIENTPAIPATCTDPLELPDVITTVISSVVENSNVVDSLIPSKMEAQRTLSAVNGMLKTPNHYPILDRLKISNNSTGTFGFIKSSPSENGGMESQIPKLYFIRKPSENLSRWSRNSNVVDSLIPSNMEVQRTLSAVNGMLKTPIHYPILDRLKISNNSTGTFGFIKSSPSENGGMESQIPKLYFIRKSSENLSGSSRPCPSLSSSVALFETTVSTNSARMSSARLISSRRVGHIKRTRPAPASQRTPMRHVLQRNQAAAIGSAVSSSQRLSSSSTSIARSAAAPIATTAIHGSTTPRVNVPPKSLGTSRSRRIPRFKLSLPTIYEGVALGNVIMATHKENVFPRSVGTTGSTHSRSLPGSQKLDHSRTSSASTIPAPPPTNRYGSSSVRSSTSMARSADSQTTGAVFAHGLLSCRDQSRKSSGIAISTPPARNRSSSSRSSVVSSPFSFSSLNIVNVHVDGKQSSDVGTATEDVDEYSRLLCIGHGSFSHHGRCLYQEDRHVVAGRKVNGKPLAFYGVYDGHEGDQVSGFLFRNLHEAFFRRCMKAGNNVNMATAMMDAIAAVDAAIFQKAIPGGSTAVCAVVEEARLMIASLGDSQAILSQNGQVKLLNQPHKPSVPAETDRIVAAKGSVFGGRILGMLGVSRAFGDNNYKKTRGHYNPSTDLVSGIPDILEHPMSSDDEFMVLASDGLFDVMSPQAVVDFVRDELSNQRDANSISQSLVTLALNLYARDNVTVSVIVFHQDR